MQRAALSPTSERECSRDDLTVDGKVGPAMIMITHMDRPRAMAKVKDRVTSLALGVLPSLIGGASSGVMVTDCIYANFYSYFPTSSAKKREAKEAKAFLVFSDM